MARPSPREAPVMSTTGGVRCMVTDLRCPRHCQGAAFSLPGQRAPANVRSGRVGPCTKGQRVSAQLKEPYSSSCRRWNRSPQATGRRWRQRRARRKISSRKGALWKARAGSTPRLGQPGRKRQRRAGGSAGGGRRRPGEGEVSRLPDVAQVVVDVDQDGRAGEEGQVEGPVAGAGEGDGGDGGGEGVVLGQHVPRW